MSSITKIVLVQPSGGCGNYILMNLCKIDIKFTLAYHHYGTHSNEKNEIYDVRFIKDMNQVKGIVVVTNRYHLDIDKIKKLDKKIIQVCIDDFNELVVLNWFLKHNAATINSWEQAQKKHWFGKYNLEKAVCEWTTKIFDKNFHDIRRISEIKNTFNFSCLYKSHDDASREFQKFGIVYSHDTHEKFLASQNPILYVWKKILLFSHEDPLSLEKYFSRGIALALHQKNLNLTKEELYDKFKLNH